MKKIVFIFLIVIGFTAYSQNYCKVECTWVEAFCWDFELDSVTADTIQVEIIDMNDGKGVVVPGVIECKFDTTYDTYVQFWPGKGSDTTYYMYGQLLPGKRFERMSVYPWYRIKIDLTGFEWGSYLIRLNVFGTCKIGKLVIKSSCKIGNFVGFL